MSQSVPVWRIAIDLPDQSCIPTFDEAISVEDAVVTAQEIDGGPRWSLICHCEAEPDRTALETRISIAAASAAIDPPDVVIEEIPPIDWVAEYQSRTKPVTIGNFYIYPSHFQDDMPEGLVGIKLDARNAFGTGEHESTSGCLVALERLRDNGIAVDRGLDMGCGSAILAIAMVRLWPTGKFVAVDSDLDSVRTAAENVADNKCADIVKVAESDGYGAAVVQFPAPYDLIAANILARPLMTMAPDAAASLKVGGHAVLSGILTEQAEMVLGAYIAAGFAPADRLEIGKWTTLVLTLGA